MRCDLHCHSFFSDGAHDPAFLLQRAADRGISHLAITDHDCIDALGLLPQTARQEPPVLIPGVEISCLLEKLEIHVIGLGINPENEALQTLLAEQQARRVRRMAAIAAALHQLGIGGLQQFIDRLPTRAPGRTQAADFLVQNGHCRDRRTAFARYLGQGKKAHVAPDWCSMAEAIQCIRDAGGVAVLAHPHRYASTVTGLRKLIANFKQAGGEALEVACANLPEGMLERLTGLALSMQMYISAGSDFHTMEAAWTDLGKIPALPEPAKKNAIWTHPGWHLWPNFIRQ